MAHTQEERLMTYNIFRDGKYCKSRTKGKYKE